MEEVLTTHKFLFPALLAILLSSCITKDLMLEQQLEGRYVSSEDILVSEYIDFKSGKKTKYSVTESRVFTENALWGSRENDFKKTETSKYCIMDCEMYIDGKPCGEVMVEGDDLTIGQRRYFRIKSFNPEHYSVIKADAGKVFGRNSQKVNLEVTIERPLSDEVLKATTESSWISDMKVTQRNVSFDISENSTFKIRTGTITLSYPGAEDKKHTVTQEGKPVISLTLNQSAVNLTAGSSTTLVASVEPSNADLTWSSNHPETASVDASGKVTAIDAGTATITVSAGDKTASCTVTVSSKENKLALTTSWTESTGLTYGNTGTITISNPSGGALSISTQPSSSVATASLSGNEVTITPVSSGETSITIKSAKVTGYAEAAKIATIKVLKATPTMTLSATKLTIEPGGNTATLSITTNSDGALSASSSNTSVATVSVSGKTLTIKSKDIDGIATITVNCTETGKYKGIYKEVAVTVSAVVVPNVVDLGLSVKWASFNLGASKPEDYGGYYQWAGTRDVTSTNIYLDWSNCPYHTGSNSSTGWTKYIPSGKYSYWSGTGSPDNKTVLDPADDVAYVNLGSKWRMPTIEEWEKLRNTSNCSWTWTSINGIKGYKVQSKKTGYTDKWIFLPAAGCRNGGNIVDVGSYGHYWSSTLATDWPNYVRHLYFYMGDFSLGGMGTSDGYRYSGHSIRPVCDK